MVIHHNKYERILQALKEFDRPTYPREISLEAQVNHNTTRVYLRRLLKARRVTQPFPGTYVTSPIYGVGSEPAMPRGRDDPDMLPRIQNLVLSYDRYRYIGESIKEVRMVGSTKVRCFYGVKRKRITVFLSNPWGLDLEGFYLALDVAREMVHKTLGIPLNIGIFKVVNMEWLNDVQGLRLEGLNCVTVTDMTGALEKIYNRGDGLRREVRIPRETSMEEVLALWRGGIPLHHIAQGQHALATEIRALKDLLKNYLDTMAKQSK